MGNKDIKWKIDDSFRVYVISRPSGDTVAVVKPNPETGEYSVEVIAGNYELIYSGTNPGETSKFISMSANQENDRIQIPSLELTPLDLIADFNMPDTSFAIKDTLFAYNPTPLIGDNKLTFTFTDQEILTSEDLFEYLTRQVEEKTVS